MSRKLGNEDWENIKAQTIICYLKAKDQFSSIPGFKVVEEQELLLSPFVFGLIRGTADFDPSCTEKGDKYDLEPADWKFGVSFRNKIGARYEIRNPGHHEINVTKDFAAYINKQITELCGWAGFNKINPERWGLESHKDSHLIIAMAYKMLFVDKSN